MVEKHRSTSFSLIKCGKTVEAYSSFSSLDSDHRLVTARIRLSLQMKRTPARKKNYDWSALKNTELQEMYTVTLRNRYDELTEDNDEQKIMVNLFSPIEKQLESLRKE